MDLSEQAERKLPARMLVVDDDPRSAKLLEGYLVGEGYQVRSAPDGNTALDLARQETPDVVLLDVMMPGMTGYEVCRQLKSEPRTRLTQVMLVTALDSTPDKVEGLDTGADDFVSKPVRREEFLAKVRALLRVRRLLMDLEDARAELSARNDELQMKRTLAQTLVHDLKNPLSAILGNLDLLEMRGAEELRYLVQRSKQGAVRMLKMILNLLDVEGLEEGRLVPSVQRLDAVELVASTLTESEAAAEQKGVRLVLEPGDAVHVDADPVLLRRVVDNLLSNAVAYTPKGGVVTVAVGLREEGVEVRVADEGPGVPEDHRERVFEKYAQAEMRKTGVTANRGLGLTFCRLAVEAHGGTIWVEEAEGGGACFRTVLPAPLDQGELPADKMPDLPERAPVRAR
jgi:signal transduction histidine kinase